MREVAIVGAGELGGLLAHVLARHDLVRQVRLIDDFGQVAAGKALDITQASSVDGFATRVSGASDLVTAAGASLVVIADRVEGGEWSGEDGLALVRRIVLLGSKPIVLFAGATQRELVERGVRELHLPRARLFGSAPEALSAAARAMVALETGGSPRDVALAVLGIPPAQLLIPWEEATLGGFALSRLLDEPARRRISARVSALWPPGPYALASAAAKAVEVLSGRSRQMVSCFVAPDDTTGRRNRTAALPTRLDARGVADVVLPQLSARDRVVLENAMAL